MRLTTVILIASLLQVSAATFGQRITLNQQNISLKSALREITRQSGYGFYYDGKVIRDNQKLDIKLSNAGLDEALNRVLSGLSLTYKVDGKIIAIKKEEKSFIDIISERLSAITVIGKVTDELGNPLAGATVIIKGGDGRANTNNHGEFSLFNVSESASLIISYIGYNSREIKVSANLSTIKLTIADSKLDEVQVIGYGTTTKRLSTSSASTITAIDIEKQPVNNILDAMIGRIAGLQVTQTSGIQGAAPNVKIRGQASISADTDPLYVLDGIPVTATQALGVTGALDNRSFNLLINLNTSDVESVTVLKDADATAIYGSRGSNGVILITTKRGKVSKLTADVRASTGFQKVGHFMDLLDVDQYIAMRKEAYANDGITPTADIAPDIFDVDTYKKNMPHNWQKEFIGKTAVSNDLGISLNGGSENTKYFISGGYHKEGSVMPGDSKMIRKSILATISNTSENKKFNIEANTNYSESTINLLPTDLVNSIRRIPHDQLYNADGSPNWNSAAGFPLASTLQNYFSPTKTLALNGLASYELLPKLKLKVTGGFTSTSVRQSQEQPLASFAPGSPNSSAQLIKQNTDNDNWIVEPQLNYSRNLGKHHLNALLGATFQKTNYSSTTLTGTNFANDNLISNIMSAGTITVEANATPYAYNAIFGRVSYDFNQELLANATFRRDGSSRFGDNRKFGNFGALGLGWIFTQRKAVTDFLPFLSYGKIRGSYGITGNDAIGNFQYLSTYYSGSGYNGSPILYSAGLSNSELRWETWKKAEAALELGFLKDRILFTGILYRNRSSNQLVLNNLSGQSGFYYYQYNFPGVVQIQGFELELTTKNTQGAFNWTTSLNLTKSDNKLVSYPDFASSNYTYRYAVGKSLNVVKGYRFAGLNTSGLPTYTYANGTVGTSPNPIVDRVILGDTDPMFGGISNDFSYKGFTFSFFLSYNKLVGVPEYYPNGAIGSLASANWSKFVLGRWQKSGDEANTIIPRFTTNSGDYISDYLSSDVLFKTRHIFRLNNAALGYTLPSSFVSKLKLNRVQLYVNAENLYVFDKHKDWEIDPQTGNSSLPPLKTFVFGINASF